MAAIHLGSWLASVAIGAATLIGAAVAGTIHAHLSIFAQGLIVAVVSSLITGIATVLAAYITVVHIRKVESKK